MRVIQLTATADADGRVRLDVPAGPAGAEFEVAVVLHAKPTTNGTGHKPPAELMRTCGAIDEDTFFRHPQLPLDPL